MIKYLATASLLLAAAYLTGGQALAAEQGITDTEIVIGDVEPLTGPPALLGVAASIGHKIAIAEANAAGGINGRKIKYVLEDDGYVTARTIQGVRKVIDVDKAFAMLGISGSGQSIAVMPVLEKAGIPTVIDVAPVKFLWEPPRKNVFVVGQSYEEGIIHLVTYLAEKNPGKKWGLITQDDDYGITVRDGFDTVVKAKKLNVVYSGNYKKGQQDFSSDMLQLKQSGAEVFLAGGIIGENIAMMKELEKLNIKPVVGIFWPGRVEPVLKLMGPAGDGIYAVDYVEPFAGAAGKAFLEKAKGLIPEAEMKGINRYSMTGYAAAKVLIAAIERCGKQPTWACTITELEKTKNVETGIMAPISFGPGVALLEPEAADYAVRVLDAEFQTGAVRIGIDVSRQIRSSPLPSGEVELRSNSGEGLPIEAYPLTRIAWRTFDGRGSASHPFRDFFQHNLGGAAADGQDPGVADHAFDRRAAHEAGAAMQLQATMHDFVQHFRR